MVLAYPLVVLVFTNCPAVPAFAFTHAGPTVVTIAFGAPADVWPLVATTVPYSFALADAAGVMAPPVPASTIIPSSVAVDTLTASFMAEVNVRVS